MICGLTDKNSCGIAYPVIYTIWKGSEKPDGKTMPGKDDLNDYFRLETEYEVIKKIFLKNVKGAKKEDNNIYFKELTVAFPFRDADIEKEIELNFPSGMIEYDKSKQFVRTCDKKNIILVNEGGNLVRSNEPCKKPHCECVPKAELYFVAKEVLATKELTNEFGDIPFGFGRISLSSVYDINKVAETLRTVRDRFPHKENSITGIPLILKKEQRSISTGRYGRSLKWMFTLEIEPVFVMKQYEGIDFHNIYQIFNSSQPTNVHQPYKPNEQIEPEFEPLEPFEQTEPEFEPFEQTEPKFEPLEQPKLVSKEEKFSPNCIKQYLDKVGLNYPDTTLKDPGEPNITIEEKRTRLADYRNEFYGEVFNSFGVEEKDVKSYLKTCGITTFDYKKVEEYYYIIACSVNGTMAIVNKITGDKYKHRNHYVNSYKLADTEKTGWPKPLDGEGWCNVIALMEQRYLGEIEKPIEREPEVKPVDFAEALYAIDIDDIDNETEDIGLT